MCDKAVDDYAHALEFVLDYYKTKKMCNKAVSFILLQYSLFLDAIKYVIRLLTLVLMYFILFLIDVKLKKCATKLF